MQTPYRTFIMLSGPLTVWWWLGDFASALSLQHQAPEVCPEGIISLFWLGFPMLLITQELL